MKRGAMGKNKFLYVFDLDGTLWEENSHIFLVEKYVGWKKYSNIFAKIVSRLMPDYYMVQLNKDFAQIPKGFVREFRPHYRNDAVRELYRAKREGHRVIILSNAPLEIIRFAEEKFQTEGFQAPVGEKDKILKELIPVWERLFVVTDNLTDMSMINIADGAIIYTTERKRHYFMKKTRLENVEYRIK